MSLETSKPASENKGPLTVPEPWDLVAEGYAAELAGVMLPISLAAIAQVEARWPSVLDRDAQVLDVATGPGTIALSVAARVREVQALDFSESMLEKLRLSAQQREIRNVFAVHGDGMALPFEENRFDSAFSMFGLMFFPDRARGFSELWRVLRPGGLAVVSSWAPLDQSPLMDLMFGALRAADPNLPPAKRNLLNLENADKFSEELQGGGFTDVSVEPYTQRVHFENAEEFWFRMNRSAAPLLLMRKHLGEEAWLVRSQLARAHLEQAFASGPLELGTTAYFGFGRKPLARHSA